MILLTLEGVPHAVFNNQIECNKWLQDNDNRITPLTSYDTFEVKHIDTLDSTVDFWIDKLTAITNADWHAEFCPETKDYIISNRKNITRNSTIHLTLNKFWIDTIYKRPSEIAIVFNTED